MDKFYIITTKYTIRTYTNKIIEIDEFNGTVMAEDPSALNNALSYLVEVARNAIRIGDVQDAVVYVRDIESNVITNIIKEVHL